MALFFYLLYSKKPEVEGGQYTFFNVQYGQLWLNSLVTLQWLLCYLAVVKANWTPW